MNLMTIAWSLNSGKVVALQKDTLKMAKMRIFVIWSNLAFLICSNDQLMLHLAFLHLLRLERNLW